MQIREKNAVAVALGRMGKGKPKTLTEAQRQALADRMRVYHVQKRKLKCVKFGCHNADLVEFRTGDTLQSQNGFFVISAPGRYCPICGGGYG